MRDRSRRLLLCVISCIDEMLMQQTNAILHHTTLQRLEASWRGLLLLLDTAGHQPLVKIRVLDVSYQDMAKDVLRAVEFDQSHLFKKIYTDEFDQPGGEPFGLLVGDFYFSHRLSKQYDDVSILRAMSEIAAAAFVPFIAGVDAGFFGLDDFSELKPDIKLSTLLGMHEYQRWRCLRQKDDTRFVGLVMPRIIVRSPYNEHSYHAHFFFTEKIRDHSDCLWGNASFAYACAVVNAFIERGWFAHLHESDIACLPTQTIRQYFSVFNDNILAKPVTEVLLMDQMIQPLAQLGLIGLQDQPLYERALFKQSDSIQSPKKYDREMTSVNAQLSSMLHYVLCFSRFAHYIKVIAREKLGSFLSAKDCERYLQQWLLQYCRQQAPTDDVAQAQYPLAGAKVMVQESAGLPGQFQCCIHLKPHFQYGHQRDGMNMVTPLLMI